MQRFAYFALSLDCLLAVGLPAVGLRAVDLPAVGLCAVDLREVVINFENL